MSPSSNTMTVPSCTWKSAKCRNAAVSAWLTRKLHSRKPFTPCVMAVWKVFFVMSGSKYGHLGANGRQATGWETGCLSLSSRLFREMYRKRKSRKHALAALSSRLSSGIIQARSKPHRPHPCNRLPAFSHLLPAYPSVTSLGTWSYP